MRFYKYFLMGFVILFLSFNQKILAMENDNLASHSVVRTVNLPDEILPVEIHLVVLSYLEQNNLLRAGRVSKTWRQAAEKVWKTKPLNLSNRCLNEADYEAIANGFFSSLILQNVQLVKENVCILARSSRFEGLDLSYNRIEAKWLGLLADAKFTCLKTLKLRDNDIGEQGALLADAKFTCLTDLDLSKNKIGAYRAGLELADAKFPLLTKLNLSENKIGAKGAGVADAKFPLLTDLDLSYNSIRAEGVGLLASANFPLLTTLNLS
jgi:Leucine-rich repeat (LRR) protein